MGLTVAGLFNTATPTHHCRILEKPWKSQSHPILLWRRRVLILHSNEIHIGSIMNNVSTYTYAACVVFNSGIIINPLTTREIPLPSHTHSLTPSHIQKLPHPPHTHTVYMQLHHLMPHTRTQLHHSFTYNSLAPSHTHSLTSSHTHSLTSSHTHS